MALVDITTNGAGVSPDFEAAVRALGKKMPIVLRAGINEAAKESRKATSKYATARYSLQSADHKDDLAVKSIMEIKKATVKSLTATMETGWRRMGDFEHFNVNPRVPSITGRRPSIYRGKVLASRRHRGLYAEDVQNHNAPASKYTMRGEREKAFMVRFENGKNALVYRRSDKPMRSRGPRLNRHTMYIEVVKSPGVMSMADRTFKKEPAVVDTLTDTMERVLLKKTHEYAQRLAAGGKK